MTVVLQDIAKRAGVSKTAVSMSLRNDPRISEPLRRRIQRLADKMGYHPNLLARAMRHRQSYTVGLLMPNFRTGVSNLKLEELEEVLTQAKLQVFIAITHGSGKRLTQQVQILLDRQVDALVVVGDHSDDGGSQEAFELTKARNKPCLFVDTSDPPESAFTVIIDRHAAMAMVLGHLLDMGHRDILFLRSNISDAPLTKWAGLRAWVKTHADRKDLRLRWCFLHRPQVMSIDQNCIHEQCERRSEVTSALLGYNKGLEIANWPLRPTAVVAPSDAIGHGVVRGLLEQGLRVPGDLSVVGFTETEMLKHLLPLNLTTVRYPIDALARRAGTLILDLIAGKQITPRLHLLTPTLSIGDSTAPPNGSAAAAISSSIQPHF